MYEPNEGPPPEAWDDPIPVLSPPPDVARGEGSCLWAVAVLTAVLGVAAHAIAAPPLPAATEAAEGRTAAKTAPQAVPRALTPAETTALNEATYIYLSSTRKDGSLSKPAEIWFQSMNGAIYVGTRPDSWRAKRLRWGRADAKIWIGARDGPALLATGAFVTDPARYAQFCSGLAAKYPKSWPRFEKGFREGLPDGSRVLIRYTPLEPATS